MVRKIRRVLLLTALMLLGATSVSAATTNRVQVKTGDAFIESLYEMHQSEGELGAINALSADETYKSNRLIVTTENKYSSFNYAGVISAVYDGAETYIVQFDSAKNAEKAYNTLSKIDGNAVDFDIYAKCIEDVDSEDVVYAAESESGSVAATTHKTWGAKKMGTDSYATYLNKTSHSQVVVAVIDTGIRKSHTLFKNKLVSGYDFVDGDTNPADEHGHGTHVSGTIADITKELTFIKIMPLRALDENGRCWSSDVAAAIRYAADHSAKVINMSLGFDYCQSSLHSAVSYATGKGVSVVVAAGNENRQITTSGPCPANIEECITVAAVGKYSDDSLYRASFSNYGSYVDTAAPGVYVESADMDGDNLYCTMSGTSMASPHVAACVAMMRAQYGSLSSAKIHTLTKRASKKIGTEQWDMYFGYGLINMSNLMKDISALDIKLSATSFKYTGSAIKPTVSVKRNGASLYADTDYSLSFSNNTKVGKASVKITGKGSYTGYVTKTFTIRPKGTSISGVTINVGGFKAKWKTVTEECSGYELQMSRYSDMSEAKIFDVPDKTIGYKSVKNLKAGKKYYIRVRTYKTVSGTKYYSSWSTITYAVPN